MRLVVSRDAAYGLPRISCSVSNQANGPSLISIRAVHEMAWNALGNTARV